MTTEIAGLFEANLNPAGSEPMYRQLHDALRAAILAGRLKPGERLPASRALSLRLGCSRNTVVEAYELLSAGGYLEGRIGAGSFVSRAFAEGWVPVEHAADSTAAMGEALPLSRVGQRLLAMAGDSDDRETAGQDPLGPDPAAFPFDAWARALARAWRRPDPVQAFRGDPMGHLPLREAIADYLGKVRAIDCEAGQVMITSGAQQALDLAARVLLDPGERVWIEDPSYRGARAVLAAAGAVAVPVPVDEEGFDSARAAAAEPAARAAFVTPSHQFPLGVTMSLSRRLKLLDWAASDGRWIFEDDYDSEFRYAGRPIPALQGLDGGQRVIYAGTFSKAMFPALRLGYLVLPPGLVGAFRAARLLLDGHTGTVAQRALAGFMADGQFSAHLRRMRTLYAGRGAAMHRLAVERLSPWLSRPPGAAGMHILLHLRADLQDTGICRDAQKAGITCQPLSSFHAGPERGNGILAGFAAAPDDRIEAVIDGLRRVLAQFPE